MRLLISCMVIALLVLSASKALSFTPILLTRARFEMRSFAPCARSLQTRPVGLRRSPLSASLEGTGSPQMLSLVKESQTASVDAQKRLVKQGVVFQHSDSDFVTALVDQLESSGLLGQLHGQRSKAIRMLWTNALLYARTLGDNSMSTGPAKGEWPNDALLLGLAEVTGSRIVKHEQRGSLCTETKFEPSTTPVRASLHFVREGAEFLCGAVDMTAPDAHVSGAHARELRGVLWVFFDLEATGLDVYSEQISQIAALALFTDTHHTHCPGRVEHRGQFECLVRPGVPVSDGAAQVTGVTTEMLAGEAPFSQRGAEFMDWLRAVRRSTSAAELVLVAHNGLRYDFLLFAEELKRHGVDASELHRSGWRVWDSVVWFRQNTKGRGSCALGALYENRFGKPLDNAHDAMADASALAGIVLAPDRSKSSSEEPEEQEADWMEEGTSAVRVDKVLSDVRASGKTLREVESEGWARELAMRVKKGKGPQLELLGVSLEGEGEAVEVECVVRGMMGRKGTVSVALEGEGKRRKLLPVKDVFKIETQGGPDARNSAMVLAFDVPADIANKPPASLELKIWDERPPTQALTIPFPPHEVSE